MDVRAAGSVGSSRRLVVDGTSFDAYFDAAVAEWTSHPAPERDLGVLSLMVTNVEAALESVDADGRNHVTELGLRRGPGGQVKWHQVEDPPLSERPLPVTQPDPDLRWVARGAQPASDSSR